jgi:hypothetical protein
MTALSFDTDTVRFRVLLTETIRELRIPALAELTVGDLVGALFPLCDLDHTRPLTPFIRLVYANRSHDQLSFDLDRPLIRLNAGLYFEIDEMPALNNVTAQESFFPNEIICNDP